MNKKDKIKSIHQKIKSLNETQLDVVDNFLVGIISSIEINSELGKECFKRLKDGLRDFGGSTYHDKGPTEVVDMLDLPKMFRDAGVDASLLAFKEILTDPEFGLALASAILQELDDWEDLWRDNEDFLGVFY